MRCSEPAHPTIHHSVDTIVWIFVVEVIFHKINGFIPTHVRNILLYSPNWKGSAIRTRMCGELVFS